MWRSAWKQSSAVARHRGTRALSAGRPVASLQRGEGCGALQVGESYHNFELQRRVTIPEYNVEALELEHSRTKAKYLHIDAKDSNNVFSVMFRTPPASSNGVAHILEHTVLCGSHKYPVRDPFFNMIKRSLNTYMNALTAYDHTMYPFSTTNAKDWENLRSVYLDAVFFPNLRELDFLQEGHRLDRAEDDPERLVYKGVVLNEMKGVMSDAGNVFATKLQQHLLDGTIYGHVSGGDPAVIPELTYEQLRAFHAKYYHPSNSCFYSYGDLPLTSHLQYLDNEILSRFDFRADSAQTRVNAAPFSVAKTSDAGADAARLIVTDGPASNMNNGNDVDPNTKFCISKFVEVASTDPFETFVMRIVSYLLTNGPSSELYKALIESQLAQDFSVGTGFDTSTFYSTFGVGVEGIQGEETVPKIQAAVREALEKVVANGFEKERVEALLHQIELSQKHIVGNFGLNLMHATSSVWCHGGDLLASLQLNPLLTRLQDELQRNPAFLESYVTKHLLQDNTKEVQLLMKPKETFVEELEQREKEVLTEKRKQLTEQDLEEITKLSKKLEAHQQEPQPVECLPTLTMADVPVIEPSNFDAVHTEQLSEHTTVEFVQVPTTNEISYMRLLFDTSSLPLEYQLYLPVFASVFGSLGTSQLRYDVLPTVIQNCSGGISCSVVSNPSLSDAANSSAQSMLLGTLCLPRKIDDTVALMYQVMTDTQFTAPENLHQLRIMLQMGAANASSSISSSGATLAGARSRVGLTQASLYHELYSGLTQIEQLQRWAQCSDDELLQLARVLQDIAQLVFRPDNLRVSVVTEDKLRGSVASALQRHLLQPLASADSSLQPRQLGVDSAILPTGKHQNQFFGFPLSVNFVVKTIPTVSFAHEDHVPLTVLAQIMSSCYVHQHVREQGGAYGGGVGQGEGTFSLSSHYDPNTWKTLEAYDNALQWACDGHFTDRDVQEALLSLFASIDAPKTPSMKGKMAFMRGITNEMRQQRREHYLRLTRQELVATAQKHFATKPAGNVVIFGKETLMPEFQDKAFYTKQFSDVGGEAEEGL
ncbi:TPA: hypothetical protein N0F65_000789 [Lagenidium giganteum]|uniref:Peptidase M16C associated domain-containing protein n=1 Tax=Lagenidium giganteum TaxID=4803 RepID=A0AAV2ZGJ0_9STRA|nr:TPA: hypothetical protein N0F65_000789 [Lagenidium giganteum]